MTHSIKHSTASVSQYHNRRSASKKTSCGATSTSACGSSCAGWVSPVVLNILAGRPRSVARTRRAERRPHRRRPSRLDQFLAKRGGSAIVSRGRALKQSQAALFAQIEQRYGVPPGPLLAIWGMETAFGAQRGNQNVLSA